MRSSHSKLRSEVVPCPPEPAPEPGEQLELALGDAEDRDREPRRKPWSWLLAHVFLVDVTVCPRCGGKLKWLEVATSGDAIRRVLAEHGVEARALPKWEARGQLELEFG